MILIRNSVLLILFKRRNGEFTLILRIPRILQNKGDMVNQSFNKKWTPCESFFIGCVFRVEKLSQFVGMKIE